MTSQKFPTWTPAVSGLLIGHFVRCQNKGVHLIAAGVTPRVLQLLKTTKTDQLFPITATVDEASSLPNSKPQ